MYIYLASKYKGLYKMLIGYQENKGYNRSDQGKTKRTKKIIKYIYEGYLVVASECYN